MTTVRRMQEESASQAVDPLERRLTEALESIPHVTIPNDFAARVMSQVPARRTVRYLIPARASMGRRVAMIAIAILFVALFGFALQTGTTTATRNVAVWAIAAEFIILTVWISLRPNQSR